MRRLGSTTFAAVIGIFVGAIVGLLILMVIWTLVRPSEPLPATAVPAVGPQIPPPAPNDDTAQSSEVAETETESAVITAPSQSEVSTPQEVMPVAPQALPGNMLVTTEEVELLRKKLRQIALAMLNFHDTQRSFPPGKLKSTGLSWRVHILPYLEQTPLYERFHLDEPWDSPHNHALLQFMPDAYRTGDEPTETRFKVFTGERALFSSKRPAHVSRIRDGTSNTLLAVHVGGGEAVPWTKPDDVVFDPIDPLAGLGFVNGRIEGILVDMMPISLPGDIPPTLLAALITPAGSEIVDGHGLSRQYSVASLEASVDAGRTTAPPIQNIHNETLGRLKTIALAMLDHENRSRVFPAAASYRVEADIPGPEMSWRVKILPLLEQEALYGRYDQKEAWNGTSNRQLLAYMPGCYRRTGDSAATSTRVQVFTGKGTAFDPANKDRNGNPLGPSSRSMPDGAHRTIMAIETGSEVMVPWMQPRDIEFNPHDPLGNIGTIEHTGIAVMHFDGAGKILSPDIDPAVFKSLVMPDDGK